MMKRQGSILATSLAMTAVFLTLVVGAAAYVNSSTARSNNDRWRGLAEQAARSGMDYVLGWAQANIDKETKLPADWANMVDGQVINPVYSYATTKTPISGLDLGPAAPGDILGPGANKDTPAPGAPSGVGEMVISRQGEYYLSFKARVLQFRVSDDQPRQYRIGVLGRVRHRNQSLNGSKAVNGGAGNEYSDIVAERFVETYVGQEPLSRYAALIDYDGVRNWVPGEVTDGPVHINRGYVDSTIDKVGATAYRDEAQTISGGSIDSLDPTKIRSLMNIRTASGGLFGALGAVDSPVFNDAVSMTYVTATDNAKLAKPIYTNNDKPDLSTAIQLDGQPLDLSGGGSWATNWGTKVFKAAENQSNKDFAGLRGPQMLRHPVELPKSVRNRIGTAMGCPSTHTIYDYSVLPTDGAGAASGWFATLPDGLYIPTKKFWANPAALDTTSCYGNSAPDNLTTGGIYIRGNVEIMRSTVQDKYSFYFLQLGYGNINTTGVKDHREYVIVANRTSGEMWVMAGPANYYNQMTAPGFGGSSAADLPDMTALITAVEGNPTGSIPGGVLGNFTYTANPLDFAQTGATAVCAHFLANGTTYPFNGTFMVDISLNDPARLKTNPFIYAQEVPVTGNIFALGDPGRNGATMGATYKPYLTASKRQLGNQVTPENEDRFATYVGTNKSGPASRLTILAAGVIFIQNDLYVDALSQYGGFPEFTGGTARTQLNVATCKDLLGLVADKQIVLGLAAKSSNNVRNSRGIVVHAAIAALGDPGFDFIDNKVFNNYKHDNYAYRGSVTTEGLMQYYNVPEDYYLCYGAPTGAREYQVTGASPNDDYTPMLPTTPCWTTQVYGTGAQALNGYPGSPIYQLCNMHTNYTADFLANPNGNTSRGRAVVLGSVTQKKRGIIGKGNYSYDKNFIYDRRLLTLAPPIFPSSANVITKTIAPSNPDRNDPRLKYMYR